MPAGSAGRRAVKGVPLGAAVPLSMILPVAVLLAAGCDGGAPEPELPGSGYEPVLDETCMYWANEVVLGFEGVEPSEEVLQIISDHDAFRISELEFGSKRFWQLWVDREERDQLREALADHPDVDSAVLSPVMSVYPVSGEDPCDSLRPRVPRR